MNTSTFVRRSRNATLAAAGLLVGVCFIRAHTPRPYMYVLTEKLRYVEDDRNHIDVLFVGSSRVYRHISPAIFDRMLAEAGWPLRSFNMGVPGCMAGEILHLLSEIGRLRPEGFAYVFVEPDGLNLYIAEENVRTPREFWWHGPTETVLAIRSTLAYANDGWTALTQSRRHLEAFLLNSTGAVRIRFAARDRLANWITEAGTARILGQRGDGFAPLILDQGSRRRRRRRMFLDNIGEYRRQLRSLTASPPQPRAECLNGYHIDVFNRLNRTIHALGAQPVYVLSPDVTKTRCAVLEAHRRGIVDVLFAFNDPNRHPELFREKNRFDLTHLNARGARVYTAALAAEFADYLRSREGGAE